MRSKESVEQLEQEVGETALAQPPTDADVSTRTGRLDATVFQDARGQGGTAVETAVQIVRGLSYEEQVYIPFQLVTRDNVDQFLD